MQCSFIWDESANFAAKREFSNVLLSIESINNMTLINAHMIDDTSFPVTSQQLLYERLPLLNVCMYVSQTLGRV